MGSICGGDFSPDVLDATSTIKDDDGIKFIDALHNKICSGTLISSNIFLNPNQDSLDLIENLFKNKIPFTLNYTREGSLEIIFRSKF